MFSQCDEEYGRRLAEGLGMSVPANAQIAMTRRGANGSSNGHADDPAGNSVVSPAATGEVFIAH